MRVLVVGNGGAVEEGSVLALLKAGHEVRLLVGDAETAREWPPEIETVESLRDAADGCDAVLHVAGVETDAVRGSLTEAERAGAGRFVFASTRSAAGREVEALVRGARTPYVIVRLGVVYGPRDEVLSEFLKVFRALMVLPLAGGDVRLRPLCYRDAGAALARAVERSDLDGCALDVVGEESVTIDGLADRFEAITDRSPLRVPIPEILAAEANRRLIEAAAADSGGANALSTVLGVEPTPLDDGLRELANALPEQLPVEGIGALQLKRFWADIAGSGSSASELLDLFRTRFRDVMPVEAKAEPHAPEVVELGATLTLNIPGRGNAQVRVAESDERTVTFATVEGHPLAGMVRFTSEPSPGALRFTIETYTRPSTWFDYLAIHTIGNLFQDAHWGVVVERVAELSGGAAPDGVQHEAKTLDDGEAAKVERWVGEIVAELRRETREAQITS